MRALKYLYNQVSNSLNQNSERDFQNFERADKIIIWIVGFSIGIFVLLFSSDLKSQNFLIINKLVPPILVTSLLIVIFGLIFRVFSFFTQMIYSKIILGFSSYASSYANAPTDEIPFPREIKDLDNCEDIIYYLKEDFKIIKESPNYENFTEEQIKEYRGLLLNYYDILADNNNLEKQYEEYTKQLANHFGLSKKSLEKQRTNDEDIIFRGKLYRFLYLCSAIFFVLTIGTFIFGACLILNEMIIHNCR